jgi:N-methylhydantoinase B
MHDRDGQDGIHTHLTNTRNAPVEVIERTYPLEVLRYGLIPDSEGAGKFRGGCGMLRQLRCLGDRVTVTISSDRRRFTPWGIETDHRARGAHCHVTSPNGQVRELPTKVVAVLEKGDVLCVETPGGGGWGNPREREREAIDQDVREGLISADRAAAVYGA